MPKIETKNERRFLFERTEMRMHEPENDADSPGTIEGYAAVFYRADDPKTEFELWEGRIVERIDRHAFDDAINNDDVRCLFDHDSKSLLGRSTSDTLTLAVDETGLHYRCALPNTNAGRDVAESIRRGDITGASFQFEVVAQEWEEREGEATIRTLTKLRLFDVGPVTFPAYDATTAGIRADNALDELQKIQRDRKAAARKQKRRASQRRRLAHRNAGQ